MKYILIIALFLSTSIYANYAFTGENAGKIDMHGGKGDSLIKGKNKFSNQKFNSLSNIGINKPSIPNKPTILIKKKKEEKENIKK
jgi:hypothetical protein